MTIYKYGMTCLCVLLGGLYACDESLVDPDSAEGQSHFSQTAGSSSSQASSAAVSSSAFSYSHDCEYMALSHMLICEEKTYATTVIGDQTWMAENLRFPVPEGGNCYQDKEENCEAFGLLYRWDMASKACPTGWHLPTLGDWKIAFAYVRSKFGYTEGVAGNNYGIVAPDFKSTEGWTAYSGVTKATNNTGFSAKAPDGSLAKWWTLSRGTTAGETAYYYDISMEYNSDLVYFYSYAGETQLSVRCLKN